MKEFSYQPKLFATLPTVKNNKHYQNYHNCLLRIDEILSVSGIENKFIAYSLALKEKAKMKSYSKGLTASEINRTCNRASSILRCAIGRMLNQESYEKFSRHLAESALLQQFCKVYDIAEIRVPSCTKLQSDEKLVPEEVITSLNQLLFGVASNETENLLNLEETFRELEIFTDATCILSNIHFPVDWSLLRDGSITILKSIARIRKAGLKSRIDEPKKLLSQVNQLAIGIGRCKGYGAVIKRRKAYRKLKKFANRILDHAKRYYELLDTQWQNSDLSPGQKDEILKGLKNIMTQLPDAIKLASQRILKGEVAKNSDKILSLYDDSSNVIIRGKSGARVEFGCKLMLSELENGFVVDWKLYEKDSDDVTLTVDTIDRMVKMGVKVKAIVGDRGCDGPKSRAAAEQHKIENKICPRSVPKFQEKMKDKGFKQSQKRRAQTEARIGILKNNFIGNAIKTKNFVSKGIHIAWAMLTHNLRLVAKLATRNINLEQAA